jgi:hypothetical protein
LLLPAGEGLSAELCLPGDILLAVAQHWADQQAARLRLVCRALQAPLAAKVTTLHVRDDGSSLASARQAFPSASRLVIHHWDMQSPDPLVYMVQAMPGVQAVTFKAGVATWNRLSAGDVHVLGNLPSYASLPALTTVQCERVDNPRHVAGPWCTYHEELEGLTDLRVVLGSEPVAVDMVAVAAHGRGLTCLHLGVHELAAAGAVSGLVHLPSFRLGPASSRAGHSASTDVGGLLRGLAVLQGLRELRLPAVDVGDERWGVLAEMPALEVLEVGEVGVSCSGAASACCTAVTSLSHAAAWRSSQQHACSQLLPALMQLEVGSSVGGGQQEQQPCDGSLTLAVMRMRMRMRWQEQQQGQAPQAEVGQQAGTGDKAGNRWQQAVSLAQWLDKTSLLLQPLWLCGCLRLAWLCSEML